MVPQLSCTVSDESSGLIGVLVIHNRVGGRSCGGVRLVPDISLAEVRSAARTMAYKAAFIGFPMGGAKAAIQIDEGSEGDEGAARRNAERLAAFGAALSGLLRSGAYLPAVDMNCTQEDIERIARPRRVPRGATGGPDPAARVPPRSRLGREKPRPCSGRCLKKGWSRPARPRF